MTDHEPVALIKACGIYIVVVASCLPISGAEVISRHRTWGSAHEARQRLQGPKSKPKRTGAATNQSTWL
jgi:hypothetical protein